MSFSAASRAALQRGGRILARYMNRFTGKLMTTVADRAVARIDPLR